VGLAVVRLGPLLVLLVLVTAMSLLSPVFLTEANLFNLGVQSSWITMLALGQLFVILTRGIDLSVGSVLGLSTVVGALAYESISSGVAIVAIMLLSGATIGLINGVILVKGRIPHPFIVTLGMLNVAAGLALLLSDGIAIAGVPDIVAEAGGGYTLGIPTPIILTVIIVGLALVVSTRTKWGRWVYAVGGNPDAAERAGIPVNRMLVSVYVLSGVSAGAAAVIVAGRTGVGDPVAARLSELDAIAAAIIGGASFFGGRGTVIGVVAGALVIGVIRNGLNLLSISPYWQLIVIGVVVVGAVALDVLRTRLEVRFRTLQAERAGSGVG
jgi:ribose transport system permease protein